MRRRRRWPKTWGPYHPPLPRPAPPSQYDFIRGVALENVLLAVACVYVAALLITRPAVAITTALVVLCITIDILGFIWMTNPKVCVDASGGRALTTSPAPRPRCPPLCSPDPDGTGPYGVDINAVSVVNLVAATGLAVEFCIHILSAFSAVRARGRGGGWSSWLSGCALLIPTPLPTHPPGRSRARVSSARRTPSSTWARPSSRASP